jgi:hypothetical protein
MDLFGALLFQVAGQQLSVAATPPGPGPHRGPVRRPSPPTELLAVDPGKLPDGELIAELTTIPG